MANPDPDRSIYAIQGVGAAAHVLQGRELEILRVHVQQPALIFVDRGVKTVRTARGPAVRTRTGQALVLGGGQTVDFTSSRATRALAAGLPTAVARQRMLEVSQATLRRRLAAEGSTLTELLVDIRMSTALTLLQATTQPVSHIALAVGYESPSRFAVRFRQRFGFAPTAVRGHERTTKESLT